MVRSPPPGRGVLGVTSDTPGPACAPSRPARVSALAPAGLRALPPGPASLQASAGDARPGGGRRGVGGAAGTASAGGGLGHCRHYTAGCGRVPEASLYCLTDS